MVIKQCMKSITATQLPNPITTYISHQHLQQSSLISCCQRECRQLVQRCQQCSVLTLTPTMTPLHHHYQQCHLRQCLSHQQLFLHITQHTVLSAVFSTDADTDADTTSSPLPAVPLVTVFVSSAAVSTHHTTYSAVSSIQYWCWYRRWHHFITITSGATCDSVCLINSCFYTSHNIQRCQQCSVLKLTPTPTPLHHHYQRCHLWQCLSHQQLFLHITQHTVLSAASSTDADNDADTTSSPLPAVPLVTVFVSSPAVSIQQRTEYRRQSQ